MHTLTIRGREDIHQLEHTADGIHRHHKLSLPWAGPPEGTNYGCSRVQPTQQAKLWAVEYNAQMPTATSDVHHIFLRHKRDTHDAVETTKSSVTGRECRTDTSHKSVLRLVFRPFTLFADRRRSDILIRCQWATITLHPGTEWAISSVMWINLYWLHRRKVEVPQLRAQHDTHTHTHTH